MALVSATVLTADADFAGLADDATRAREASKVMQHALLVDARLSAWPYRFNFGNELLTRSPQGWCLIFEHRDLTLEHFVTEDLAKGKLTVDFEQAVTRTFSCVEEPPYRLDPEMMTEAATLVRLFQSIGTLWLNIPFDRTAPTVAAATIITVLTPLFHEAKKVIRRMNAHQVDALGYSGARYTSTRRLDPLNFPDEDREGIKRGVMKSESIIERVENKRSREEDTTDYSIPRACHKCSKMFTGKWSKHKSSGECS